jgi:hypothetical protein
MSLNAAAKHLAAHGRGPDTHLVHMSTREIKSLNDLAMAHGGHLTINPHTGLPEAGFLNKLLPAIIGGGLALMSGGASIPLMGMSLSAPAAIGLGVGGVEALRTGDVKKGLMAGLGAYGGAGVIGGLAGAGAGAIGQEAAKTAVTDAAGQTFADDAARQAFMNEAVTSKMAAATPWDQLAAGVQNPGMAIDAMGGPMSATVAGLQAFGPAINDAMKEDVPTTAPENPAAPMRYDYGQMNPQPAPDVPAYGDLGQDFGRQNRYFPDAGYKSSTVAERGFAGGGLSDLGMYSDGGRLLRGPGDGVSDSIPAQIGKHQPARLADGEFVVPARIVSELGNGSTEAGARKLYAMMDRVQKARGKTVGKGKIATNSRAEKHLPA